MSEEEKTRARLVAWFILDCMQCARECWETSDLTVEEMAYSSLYLNSKVRAFLKDENTKPAVYDIYQHFEVQGLDYHERKK